MFIGRRFNPWEKYTKEKVLVAGAIYIGVIMGISVIIRDETGGGAIGLGTGVAVALGFGTFGGMLG